MVLFVGFGASVGVGCEGGSDTGDADVIGTGAGARNNGVEKLSKNYLLVGWTG